MGLYFSEGLAGLHPEAKATMENTISVSGHQVTLGGPSGVMVMTEFRCATKYMSKDGQEMVKRSWNRECEMIKKMIERWFVLSDQQAASLLSVVVMVSQGVGLTHCQVESDGEEAEHEAG